MAVVAAELEEGLAEVEAEVSTKLKTIPEAKKILAVVIPV
jgi:hypothetical protein